MQDCGGGTATALFGMLMTSAVAIFFSCSGATEFSEIEFDSEGSVTLRSWSRVLGLKSPALRYIACTSEPKTRDLGPETKPTSLLTAEADKGYVSSSFFGAVLSILTPVPLRIVRKIL